MKKVTYKASGVNIESANIFVNSIKGLMSSTMNQGVLRDRGAFGSLFAFPKNYKNPILVSSTDGVGTKLLLAQMLGQHDTVGIDLVGMNVNDVLCCGARPLFFLDYIACGKLDPKILKEVVKGITDGCKQAGCALIGGETAEMPGMYKPNEYDLAGFTVGVVEQKKLINGSRIKAGDYVVGLPSSGVHSNGYSLVRKVFTTSELKKYAPTLMAPTRIYVNEVFKILETIDVKGLAHITGGAYYEKLTKILPEGKCFSIKKGSWDVPEIFHIMQKKGRISDAEMYRTFNMGIGMAVVISPNDLTRLRQTKIKFYEIGKVVTDKNKKVIFN